MEVLPPYSFFHAIESLGGMLNNLGLSSVKMCTVLLYFAGEQGRSQKQPRFRSAFGHWKEPDGLDRTIQELLLKKTKGEKKEIYRFRLPVFQQRKKFGCGTGRITGSFNPFLFFLGRFHFRETVFRGKGCLCHLDRCGKRNHKKSQRREYPRTGIR